MIEQSRAVKVHILDKEYLVACPPHEREALHASAEYLSSKMKEIRDTGKIVGADRIAVMAALNLAHDLLQDRNNGERIQQQISQRIRALQEKIDVALNSGNQLEL
jgi:cell division protein ZapA